MKAAAIIVAAGCSSRFDGGNKLLAEFEGAPLIRHAVAPANASPVHEIIIVVGPDSDALLQAAGPGRWRSVVNADASAGLSSSIRTGLAALSPDSDGALIMLADMPRISTDIITILIATFAASGGRAIVVPRSADGRQGNPVLWPRALFNELNRLTGDIGGKAVLAAHPELLKPVIVGGDAIHFDVDTVSDLARTRG